MESAQGKEGCMEREELKRLLPTFFLLTLCMIIPRYAFGGGEPWYGALLFHFSHANIFHLLGNFVVIARFKPRWTSIPWAYLSASVAAICPFTELSVPTCGISAMVFAMLARRDAILGIRNWQLLLFNMLFAVFPSFNWKIHLVSYLISYTIWLLRKNQER